MITTYYLTRLSIEKNVVGVMDDSQVEIYRDGFIDKSSYDGLIEQFGSRDSWKNIKNHSTSNIVLQYVKPRVGAKITSFLSYSPWLIGCPFMVAKDVYDKLKKYNFSPHHIFDANLIINNEVTEYLLLSCPSLDFSVIDFSKSIFFEGSFGLNKKYIYPKSYEELEKIRGESAGFIRAEKYVFNNNFNDSLDFYVLSDNQIFISERLAKEITCCGYDGLSLLPAFGKDRKWTIIGS